jgi:hypothetical protein
MAAGCTEITTFETRSIKNEPISSTRGCTADGEENFDETKRLRYAGAKRIRLQSLSAKLRRMNRAFPTNWTLVLYASQNSFFMRAHVSSLRACAMKVAMTLAFSASLCATEKADPPDAAVVGRTAVELWKEMKIPELGRYLTALERDYPNRLSSVVGSAFLDLIYRADYNSAYAKLDRVITAWNATQFEVPQEFRTKLAFYSHSLRTMIELMEESGTLQGAIEAGSRSC